LTRTGRGRGLGKLILCGEHAVVYGHPALAMAVDLSTEVTVRPSGATAIHSNPRLTEALTLAVGDTDLSVEIASNVPIGRGMGSSAALAVALVRAMADAAGQPPPNAEEVFERAMPIERVFHGNPSGLDVAVSARGGVIRYRRGDPPLIEPIARTPAGQIVVLDTGLTGNTAQLVATVGAQRPDIDPILARIGSIATMAVEVLDHPPKLGALLTENHRLLKEIGVSTPELDDLVAVALEAGAHGAKLSGAGGGGVVIALTDDPERILEAADRRGIAAIRCAGAPHA
jgi:mevalonate kinase